MTAKRKKIIELSDLLGEHWLDAVDYNNVQFQEWDGGYIDANSITFRLDGVCYTATEDPGDGYRSSMDEVYVKQVKMRNVFNPTWVLARKARSDTSDDRIEAVDFVDMWNGEVIMSVGTDYGDDYYPTFVSYWAPENMQSNQGK